MSDHVHTDGPSRTWKIDKAWAASGLILIAVALFLPSAFMPTITFAGQAMASTGPFIAFAVLAVAWLKATGAEATLARAFEGKETRMIVAAALFGGLSPFCSCEVIPFIAALLAIGAPLSAVMAFWLASPLMDPPMFFITAGTLGFEFAIAKALSAVALGLIGGFGVKALGFTGLFHDPLKAVQAKSCGCGPDPFSQKPVWKFWGETTRVQTFRDEAIRNAIFLTKWLLLAYILESLMIAYIPAEWIAGTLGGEGIKPVFLGALFGGPAYLNGYAAVPLIAGMLEQGMSQGAAMAFVLAGGVSCIPAAVAVWALVKPRVFAAYLGFAFIGSLIAGSIWGLVAPLVM
jgi:uncharacterized membrane protein YraQ (UPF0718 family)